MRPARKPWTPSINAAGLGMLPMGSVGSITLARVEVVATASETSHATPRPGADRQRPRTFDSNRGDLALGTGRCQGSRDRPTTTLGVVAADPGRRGPPKLIALPAERSGRWRRGPRSASPRAVPHALR